MKIKSFVDELLRSGASPNSKVCMSITMKSREGSISTISFPTTLSLVSKQYGSLRNSTRGKFVGYELTLVKTIDEQTKKSTPGL